MIAPQSGQAVRPIGPGVLVVSHPDTGGLEQTHHRGKHFFPWQAREFEISLHSHPDGRQLAAECQQTIELGFVSNFSVPGMIAVLLAAARVSRRNLDVTALAGTDPHVRPRGRNDERANATECFGIRDPLSINSEIDESLADPSAANARRAVGYVAQPGRFGSLLV